MGRNKFPQVTQLENENSFQIESRSTFLSSEIDTKPLAEPTKPLRPVKVFTENENSKKEDLNKRVLTEEEQEEEEERKERIRMIKRNTRKMLVFSITNFGMLGLVLGYIFLGAILFQTLEQHTETQNCETGKGAEQDMIKEYTQLFFNYIYFNITTDPLADLADGNSTLDGPEVYNAQLDAYIYEIRDFVLLNQATYKYYGQDDCQELSMWQTQSAVLFAVTVVTSIGYGHVFPTTWQGQIVILCYATIGIPLFLITTAKISFMLADIFAFLYKYIILCPCTFAVIIKKRNERLKREAEEEEDDDESGGKMSQMSWDNFVQKEPKIVDEETDQEEEEEKTTKVPLIVILGFYAGFLILGSYIFHILEEWTLITGAYFAYVSLSTIGFGDYVPGTTALVSGEKTKSAFNLTIAVIYIFVGISVLGMTFSLMNSTITDKVSTISELIKKNHEHDAELKRKLEEENNNRNDENNANESEV